MASTAQVFQFATNPNRAVGWDKPVRYNPMFRVKGEDKKLTEQPATAANSLPGDADLA